VAELLSVPVSREVDVAAEVPPVPPDLAYSIRDALSDEPEQSWDEALWEIATDATGDVMSDDVGPGGNE